MLRNSQSLKNSVERGGWVKVSPGHGREYKFLVYKQVLAGSCNAFIFLYPLNFAQQIQAEKFDVIQQRQYNEIVLSTPTALYKGNKTHQKVYGIYKTYTTPLKKKHPYIVHTFILSLKNSKISLCFSFRCLKKTKC
jgi:hypothetical protein